jgi:signal transduction histidine kinase
MKNTLFLWGLLLGTTAFSQNIDSLKNALAAMPDDTNRVMAYRQLWFAHYDHDQYSEMLETAEKGLVLSQNLRFDKGIDLFLFYKASTLDIAGRGKEAIPVFEEGLRLAQKNGDSKGVANYQTSIGTAYYTLGDLDKALQYLLAAYPVYKELGLQKNLSKVLNNIGIIYRTQGKRARAEEIYKESLAIKQALRDTLGMAASYQNLASVLSTSDRESEMLGYLGQALAIYEKHQRAADAAGCYSLLGQIHFNFNRLAEAKTALLKAKSQYDQKPSAEYSSNVYRLLGSIAALQAQPLQAEAYLLESLKWARQFGQRERAWDILNELSKAQQQLGKSAAAYRSLREAYAIRDSVTEEKRLALMEEMQVKFDVAQKDSDLKINQLSLLQRTLERNWLLAGAGLLGLLSLAIFVGLRSRIRANKKIAAQESALQQQQILRLEQDAEVLALRATLEGQEQERNRIAADLHDGLGGLLASVKSHFNALPQPAAEAPLFGKTNRLLDEACGEVRRISHNMMPRALALSGLPDALEDLAQNLEKQGLKCQLEIFGLTSPPLDAAQSAAVYRIVQELTNNVVKHAQAEHLLLQLIRRDGTLSIIAEDDGRGFDLSAARAKKGLGLASMEARARALQGAVEWDSVPGQGTVVSITLPI